jgi:hypothetical protein
LLKIQLRSPLVKGRSKPLRSSDERGGGRLPTSDEADQWASGGTQRVRSLPGGRRRARAAQGRSRGDGAACDGGVRAPTRTMEAGDEEPVGEAGRRRRQELQSSAFTALFHRNV